MKEFISSQEARNILSINRTELHILCKFDVLKPKRVKHNRFLYDLNEINELVVVRNRVKVIEGLCKNS